jgi:hypothetical protein
VSAASGTTKGRVLLNLVVQKYVSEEEQRRLDEEALEEQRERSRLPRVLATMDILSVTVSDLVQVYGLFKNSPKVDISVGCGNAGMGEADWKATTGVKFNAGSFAQWRNLGWRGIPLRDRGSFCVEVTSGNEKLGELKMSTVQLINIMPVGDADSFREGGGGSAPGGHKIIEIKGQLIDGRYAKGRVSMQCRLDVEGIAAVMELQEHMGFTGLGGGGSQVTVEILYIIHREFCCHFATSVDRGQYFTGNGAFEVPAINTSALR